MKKPTTITSESVSEYREFIELRLRKRVLEAIEVVIDEELDQALGCRAYERSEERRGYRNGTETRRVTTAVGTRELRVPRARVRDEETGETKEFRSDFLPRYQRRTREVDEAILATYLSGANSRRIRKALKPLLGDEHLSKSAVSRVVSRLKERFEEWQSRELSDDNYAIVFLDGFHLKVRMAKRVVSVPVLAALGVAPDGKKQQLSLRPGNKEWRNLRLSKTKPRLERRGGGLRHEEAYHHIEGVCKRVRGVRPTSSAYAGTGGDRCCARGRSRLSAGVW